MDRCMTQSPPLLQDWNIFLLRFNEIDFCVSENETLKHSLNESTTPESTVTSGQARSSTQAPLLLEDPGPINISVPITLTLDPLRPFGGYSRNITHLYATVLVGQVGLAGESTCVFSPFFLNVTGSMCINPFHTIVPSCLNVFFHIVLFSTGPATMVDAKSIKAPLCWSVLFDCPSQYIIYLVVSSIHL